MKRKDHKFIVSKLGRQNRDITVSDVENVLCIVAEATGRAAYLEKTTDGYRIIVAGEGSLPFHRPHPGKFLKPYLIKEFRRVFQGVLDEIGVLDDL